MKKRLFALAGALLLLASGSLSAEEPITYDNVAIPEIRLKRKKRIDRRKSACTMQKHRTSAFLVCG